VFPCDNATFRDIFPITIIFFPFGSDNVRRFDSCSLFPCAGPFSTKKDTGLQDIVRAQPRPRVELNLFDRHTLESFTLNEGQLDEQSLRALGLQIDGDKEKERRKDREKKRKVGGPHTIIIQFTSSLFYSILFTNTPPCLNSATSIFIIMLLLTLLLPIAQAGTASQKCPSR
jgi:hypothetical protein